MNMYMPMEALLLLGALGFSSKSIILPSSSVFIMPNLEASSIGTGMTAIVTSAPLLL